MFKNTSVSRLSINKAGVILVLDDLMPYSSLDKLFSAFGSFSRAEKVNHAFGKTKSGKLSVSFSATGVAPSMGLLLKCSCLFFAKKNE